MKDIGKRTVANLVLILVSLLIFIPLLLILNVALKTSQEFLTHPISIVESFKWSNFKEAWVQAEMNIYFINSFIYTFFGSLGTAVIATLAAFPIARQHFKGANLVYLLFLAALFLPGGLVPLLFIMNVLNFMDTYHGFILLKIAMGLPVSIFILTGFLKGLPKELDEAATMDGCGYLKYIMLIVFPLIKPAFFTVTMLAAIGIWNDFINPYLFITEKEMRPLTAGLYMFFGQYSTNWPVLAAGIIVVAAPLVLIYLFLQRYIISGITSGAVKG
ncbi:carbohydrate ABC transporter permease [Gracilibacillus phocaeensis]|uniref:carbohydrate ABC transporter permease n=1 Tax=Gracilibacillus phocaeensis TaxID=2042304 RepID=UPI00102F8A1B|nr:carbohydrate ABC transporter permease [Gracilibacillus phocaeensis]